MSKIFIIFLTILLVTLSILLIYKFYNSKPKTSENYTISSIDVNNLEEQKDSLRLSFMSYINSLKLKNLLNNDCSNMRETLSKLRGILPPEWQVVWGPAMGRTGNSVLSFYDNMMFVVKNRNATNKYKLVIRGTNPVALNSWLFQDFMVANQIQWDNDLSHGSVSEGTYNALYGKSDYDGVLLIKPCAGLPGGGKTIIDYLKTLPKSAKLNITGHSLGGLLSTTLHLYFENNRNLWDVNKKIELTSISFAAPTAGNALFAQYSQNILGNKYIRIANELDPVTLAWDNFGNIENLYKNMFIINSIPVNISISVIARLLAGKNYKQLNNVSKFKGQLQPLFIEFFSQAAYQHSTSYYKQYNLPENPITSYILA